ncbi:lipoate--protein ligase family protein [Malaciobacter mytili]|uniref:lipoate--protein ligase family protein n=1 Tax=Malaciobacter mytili TaxID=603050 RepID=UPI003A8AC832
MIKNKKFRLIVSNKQNTKVNMSIDKALASCFKENDLPILRLYTWENSFTVGLSQKCEDYKEFINEYKNNCAKRITGGGVLFHGHDLSYSLVLPSNDFEGLSVKQSYERICQFLLTFYKNLGLEASFAKDLPSVQLSKHEFCQIGYEAYDILVNGTKIGGNAQKRAKKMIFQHGSIPIYGLNNKKRVGSSLEEFNINMNFEEATKRVIEAFKESFDVEFLNSSLNSIESEKLTKILEE